jgi:hypothetical protein
MKLAHFWHDRRGGPFVEAAVMIPILFTFLFGSVDFLYAFYQWNSATKAVEVGARLAAVSDPVASGLNDIAKNAVSASVRVGDEMPAFTVDCNGASASCSCSGSCGGVGYAATAMNTIVYGRGSSACDDAGSYYFIGMCDIFWRIEPSNVRIVYQQTGLGFAGRVAGPVPTISVSLQNLTFQFFFLNGFGGFSNLTMPAFTTTITGEALSSAAQS